MMSKIIKVTGLIVVGLAIFLGAKMDLLSILEPRPITAEPVASPEPITVEVAKPFKRTLHLKREIPGTLMAYETVDIYAKTSGYISKINVDIGSRVRAGDLLIEIDVPEMIDELHQAEAVLGAKRAYLEALVTEVQEAESMIQSFLAKVERAKAAGDLQRVTTGRQEKLYEGRALSKQKLDESQNLLVIAKADLKISEAELTHAERKKAVVETRIKVANFELAVAAEKLNRLHTLMRYAFIRAPFDGVVTKRLVHPGAFIRSAVEGPTSPLLSVARIDRLRLVLQIAEPDIASVKVGTQIKVEAPSMDIPPLLLAIDRMAYALNPQTRTMQVEADLENSDGRFQPGMYVKAIVRIGERKESLMIPSKALRKNGREIYILDSKEEVVEAARVVVGYDDGIWAEIVDGLNGDEWVVTSASSLVEPGSPVFPVRVDLSQSPEKEG